MIRLLTGVVALLLFASGCVGEDRMETTSVSLEPEDATFVEVELKMSTGNMALVGGAEGLLEGEFVHQLSDYKPVVEYEVERNRGHLVIDQPSIAADTEDGTHYVSTINLTSDIPMDLTFSKTEGNTDINLQGMLLNSLTAVLGEKDVMLDLSGDYPTLTEVNILSASGEDVIRFDGNYPSLTDLSITLNSEMDDIDVIGRYDVLSALYIETGDGSDNIEVRGEFPEMDEFAIVTGASADTIVVDGGFGEMTELIIDVGTGDDIVDLTGTWTRSLNITIISEEDSVTLRLPNDVGVYVEATNRTAEVNAANLQAEEAAYVNELYGESDVVLTIRLDTSTGEAINIFEVQME